MDSIFAQSSARGKAGVAVFRISGPNSLEILRKLSMNPAIPVDRAAALRKIFSKKEELIDHAMVIYFKGPNSFTGEDVVEIHTHGSIAVIKILTDTLLDTGLVRLAEPGEFARRAFMNGKMDLTRAEGLADLIESETIMQHKQALRQMSGELEALYSGWRAKLLGIISLLEAFIDFPEEEIPENILKDVEENIASLKFEFSRHLNDNRKGERLRNGLMLTILGAPNVGKSSLLNFLAKREVSIVSNMAGTTRDVIESHLDIGGYPIIISDTAGLRQGSSDVIENEGIKRALKAAEITDIKIIMLDAENMSDTDPDILNLIDMNTILLINKIDLNFDIIEQFTDSVLFKAKTLDIPMLFVSIKEKIGLEDILLSLENVASKIAMPQESPSITRSRHRYDLTNALDALKQCNIRGDIVLATEDIRMAIRYMSILTGKIEVDEILGEIFSKFCIGK